MQFMQFIHTIYADAFKAVRPWKLERLLPPPAPGARPSNGVDDQ